VALLTFVKQAVDPNKIPIHEAQEASVERSGPASVKPSALSFSGWAGSISARMFTFQPDSKDRSGNPG